MWPVGNSRDENFRNCVWPKLRSIEHSKYSGLVNNAMYGYSPIFPLCTGLVQSFLFHATFSTSLVGDFDFTVLRNCIVYDRPFNERRSHPWLEIRGIFARGRWEINDFLQKENQLINQIFFPLVTCTFSVDALNIYILISHLSASIQFVYDAETRSESNKIEGTRRRGADNF